MRGTTEVKDMMATAISGRERATEYPPVRTNGDGTGGKYRVGWTGPEESVAESAKWRVDDIEELASEEESKTAGWGRARS